MKKIVEEAENDKCDEIVKMVLEQDKKADKEFDSERKSNQDKWNDKFNKPYPEEARDIWVKFEALREIIVEQSNWDAIIGNIKRFRMIKFTNIIIAVLYLFNNTDKEDIMEIDPI